VVVPLKLTALAAASLPLKVPEFVIFPDRLRAKPFNKNWFSVPLFTVRFTKLEAAFNFTILLVRTPAGLLLTIIFPNGIVDDTKNPFAPPALSLVPSPKRMVAPLMLYVAELTLVVKAVKAETGGSTTVIIPPVICQFVSEEELEKPRASVVVRLLPACG
jgi:hypothetical protein